MYKLTDFEKRKDLNAVFLLNAFENILNIHG